MLMDSLYVIQRKDLQISGRLFTLSIAKCLLLQIQSEIPLNVVGKEFLGLLTLQLDQETFYLERTLSY